MSSLGKTLTILVIMLALGAGLVFWKSKHPDENGGSAGITKVTKEDMSFLLADANPMVLKRLADDPDAKKKYVEGLQQFLAVASEARKEGLADDPKYKPLLDFVRSQVIALSYDKEKNKDKGSLPPFSFIKKEDVDAYFQQPGAEEAFNKLVRVLVDQTKEESPDAPEPTPEQLAQLKDQYGKVKIDEKLATDEKAQLGEEFARHTELQIQLQQAALLNQLYAKDVLAKKVEPTDAEVKAYIAAHPEFDPAAKKAKAEEILKRAKAGEDFAKLADEASEDPGNKDPKTGAKQGGLYKNVKPGSGFDKNFEAAALALQPGQVTDSVVETPFGYHIIKLERRGPTKDKDGKDEGETYDVRHILISTMFTDPQNPFGQPTPMSEKIKTDLGKEKSDKILEDIKAKNPIAVEDFDVPKPSDEQIQQMMKQQQQMQGMPPGSEDGEDGAPIAPPTGKQTGKPAAPPAGKLAPPAPAKKK